MQYPKAFARAALAAALGIAVAAPASAAVFSGNLYYTLFSGGPNVWRVGYSYNDATQSFALGSPANVASTFGADGIIFAPNGNLLIGGQNSGNVYEVNPVSGALVHVQHTSTDSYHLALDPNGGAVYTSTFMGPLQTLSMPIGSAVATTAISGDDGGITQVAFGTGAAVFYVNGNPNGGGNLGTIDLSSGVTTRIHSGVAPAHGLIYDPYTQLMTMFGAGQTGTMSAADGSGLLTSGAIFGVNDFDQGAVDGLGHALVAGAGAITFIDYHLSHDVTNPDYTVSIGGFDAIDDVAPLAGPGSNPNPAPEPGMLTLLGLGLGGVAMLRRRSR